MPALEDLHSQRPLADGRIRVGLGFDSFTIPWEEVESIISQSRKDNLHLITAHHLHGPIGKNHFSSILPFWQNTNTLFVSRV
jgi:hypothetical protein